MAGSTATFRLHRDRFACDFGPRHVVEAAAEGLVWHAYSGRQPGRGAKRPGGHGDRGRDLSIDRSFDACRSHS
jgi:hypothetical protein